MAMVMKDWLWGVIENQLQEALQFQENKSENLLKNFSDNGSTMRISCRKPDVKQEYLQLVKASHVYFLGRMLDTNVCLCSSCHMIRHFSVNARTHLR